MLNWFKKSLYQPVGIEIKQSALHDRGVFAGKLFKPGAIIEIAPAILLQKEERQFLQGTALFNYYFLIADENTSVALGLGNSSLYNHSSIANAVYSISVQHKTITIKACKTINWGDEITLNYNGSPNDTSPVYFAPEG